MSLDTSATDGITLAPLGTGADFSSQPNGDFTVTPTELGGPLDFVLVAAHACGAVALDFTIAEVEEAVTTIRLVHLFEGARSVDVAISGSDDSLVTLDFLSATGPLVMDPDAYEFDLLVDDEDGDTAVAATTPAFDFAVGHAYTVVAHADDGDLEFTVLEDDVRMDVSDDMATMRGFHGAHNAGLIDLSAEDNDGTTTWIAQDLSFGDTSPYVDTDLDLQSFWVDTDDGDFFLDASDIAINDGDILNAHVTIVDDLAVLLLQTVNDDTGTYALLTPELSFDDVLGGPIDATFSTGGDADWSISFEEVSTGLASIQAGNIDHGELTWFDAEITVDAPGELFFDWFASSESGFDRLVFCDDPDDCSRTIYTAGITGETGWETYAHEIEEAGTHTFRWAYAKDNSLDRNRDTGWVDNIEFFED